MRALLRRLGYLFALLAGVLAGGCDRPFEPLQPNAESVFSLFGYLDLYADTQWVRVMPVRQSLLLGSEPLDAVVTLEQVGSGRVVTLRDSLFAFPDEGLGGAGYAHNFWTTERLQPRATYRLKAVRPGGDSTMALVAMPDELVINFRNDVQVPRSELGYFFVQGGQAVFVDVLYSMRNTCGSGFPVHPIAQRTRLGEGVIVRGDSIGAECAHDLRRQEIRASIAPAGWPYDRGLSELDVSLPDRMPSNVENGLGFVGGVATRTIPFHRCEVVVQATDRTRSCEYVYDARSASIAGKVVRQPCGAAHAFANIRMLEQFPDGHSVIRSWKTGPEGEYRFEGIEPGARLVLELTPGTSAAPLPTLGPGERYRVADLAVSGGC